jgi:signal peptidase I
LTREYGRFETGSPADRRRRPRRKLSKQQEFVSGLDAVHIVALIMTVYMLLFRIVVVVGPSMYDTLIEGDRLLLVSSLVCGDPEPGDIVVCSEQSFDGGQCFVKRVIATEGQLVDIDFKSGTVYVDHVALQEDYIHSPTTRYEGINFPITVEEGHIFVLGDNRDNSTDSRSPLIGQVDKRQIVGKAIFILSPGDNGGREEPQFSRVGWIG